MAERTLGPIEGPEGQQLNVKVIVQSAARGTLFSVHVEPSPSGERQWTPIWTATPAMQLRENEPASPLASVVLELITPDVWDWAWRQAQADSQDRVERLADELRLAELELLLALAHTGGLPAPTAEVVASLADGWAGTSDQLLETALLIDQETDRG